MLDTLICGAKIVDGTGKAAFTADVGILDGMIEAVGNLSGAQAFETIEAAAPSAKHKMIIFFISS